MIDAPLRLPAATHPGRREEWLDRVRPWAGRATTRSLSAATQGPGEGQDQVPAVSAAATGGQNDRGRNAGGNRRQPGQGPARRGQAHLSTSNRTSKCPAARALRRGSWRKESL